MTDTAPGEVASAAFKVLPDHKPGSEEEMYSRVQFYAGVHMENIAAALEKTIKEIRRNASTIEDSNLRLVALKEYNVDQLIAADKEVFFNWMQQDAQEQGEEDVPEWLNSFFGAAAWTVESMYPNPPFKEMIPEYWFCVTKNLFCQETAERVLQALGFGKTSTAFVKPVEDMLVRNRSREHTLEGALTLPIEQIREKSPL